MDCIFCQIIRGEAESDLIETGPGYVIITPLAPHTRGHVLVIPKKHVTHAVDAPAVAGRMMKVAARYLRAQGPQGNIITSAGPLATQTVDHLHLHVIPRGPSDDLPIDWPWMREG